jgi:hypothetical protein
MRSAAWRISLWASLAFAIGTMLVFAMLHRFGANDIQRRSDAWLSGEVEVLSDVAERTPKDRLYRRVVGEVAELASREVPNRRGNWASHLRAKSQRTRIARARIGLAFVEAVVRVHGGSVKALNRHKGGAQLTITLPRCEVQN